jgi:hypothetical protein
MMEEIEKSSYITGANPTTSALKAVVVVERFFRKEKSFIFKKLATLKLSKFLQRCNSQS